VACPFFHPTERLDQKLWTHPRRLPLGGPGEEFRPREFSMLDCCNLGYARSLCPRFPADGVADAARFAVGADRGGLVIIQYVVEKDYLPLEHGILEFDRGRGAFRTPPQNAALARQAHVYVESYLGGHDARL
jgi:hypothetical protein